MRKYISTFYSAPADLNYTVELWDLDGSGQDVQMTMGVPAVTIDWPEVEPYEPLMTSGCTLKYITNGVYTELMANGYRDVKVVIYSHWKDNGVPQTQLVWSGWLTPNIYSQPYDHDREELELTAIDELSCLQYISYRQFVSERSQTGNVFVRSMFDVIRLILLKYCLYATNDIRDEQFITHMYLTDAVKLGQGSSENALRELYVNEQLFIDEDMSCKEAIEACLHYVNETGFMQYGIFEAIDRDNVGPGLTLFKYPIANPASYTTTANVTYLVNNFDDYFQNTLSTRPVYNDISYTARFSDFPSWQQYKQETTYYDTTDIIQLTSGSSAVQSHVLTNNFHDKLNAWPSALSEIQNVTRMRLAQCPNNVDLYVYNSTGGTVSPISTYPWLDTTNDDYYKCIQQMSINLTSVLLSTNDRNQAVLDGVTTFYNMGGVYVDMEDTRTEEDLNNTGVRSNNYIVLFQNALKGYYQDSTHRYRLADIHYNSKMITLNRGYLDISGTVRFENLARRIPNTDHKAKVEKYNKQTTNLLSVIMSIQIGDYYFYPMNDDRYEWRYVDPTSSSVNEYTGVGVYNTLVPLDANEGEDYFSEHSIARSFANIDIDNKGFLVPLDGLPEIYGDIRIGLWTFRDSDDQYTSNKAKYNEISTIFISDLDVDYINAPMVEGNVEYYNSSPDGTVSYLIEQNTFKDENIISTFIDNQQIDITNNRLACQHEPCNNMALVKISGHYVPASTLYYMNDITASSPAVHQFIPEDYSAHSRYNQYSTSTLKFELLHRNAYDVDVQLKFKNSTSNLKYYIAGASIDYYENLVRYTLMQKK